MNININRTIYAGIVLATTVVGVLVVAIGLQLTGVHAPVATAVLVSPAFAALAREFVHWLKRDQTGDFGSIFDFAFLIYIPATAFVAFAVVAWMMGDAFTFPGFHGFHNSEIMKTLRETFRQEPIALPGALILVAFFTCLWIFRVVLTFSMGELIAAVRFDSHLKEAIATIKSTGAITVVTLFAIQAIDRLRVLFPTPPGITQSDANSTFNFFCLMVMTIALTSQAVTTLAMLKGALQGPRAEAGDQDRSRADTRPGGDL